MTKIDIDALIDRLRGDVAELCAEGRRPRAREGDETTEEIITDLRLRLDRRQWRRQRGGDGPSTLAEVIDLSGRRAGKPS